MITLGQRIFLISVASVVAVAVLAVSLTGVRRTIESDVQDNRAISSAKRLWDQSLEQYGDRIRSAVGDAAGGVKGAPIDAAMIAQLSRRNVKMVTFYDEIGQQSLVWPAQAVPLAIDSRRISQIVSGGEPFQLIGASAGGVDVVVGGALPYPTPTRAGFVASASIEPLLADVTQSGGASAFIMGAKGDLLARNGVLSWDSIRDLVVRRSANVSIAWIGEQAIQLVVMPLAETFSGMAGYVCVASDVTVERRLLNAADSLAIALIAVFCLVVILSLRWLLSRLTEPLSRGMGAMSALAGGDTGVEVLGGERKDEIGRMARSVKVFRDRMRAVRNTEERRVRQWQRQHDFIRMQMIQLAGTLSEEGRASFLSDLQRIETANASAETGTEGGRSLGVALEVMTDRVRAQHKRLDGLVGQLQTSLAQKSELFQLQEQVAMARRMQENMLPRGVAPGARFEAAAKLVAAEEVDGGFYDYVSLSGQRLGVLLGQPVAGGLAGSFVAANAHTSLKALLSADIPPADCLARTAGLLAGDPAAEGMALAIAVLDPESRELHWASAGFNSPVLMRRMGDVIDSTLGRGGTLVPGDAPELARGTAVLPPRAGVVLASPAVFDDGGGYVSRNRLIDILREATDGSAAGLLAALRSEGALTELRHACRDRFCVVLRAKD